MSDEFEQWWSKQEPIKNNAALEGLCEKAFAAGYAAAKEEINSERFQKLYEEIMADFDKAGI